MGYQLLALIHGITELEIITIQVIQTLLIIGLLIIHYSPS